MRVTESPWTRKGSDESPETTLAVACGRPGVPSVYARGCTKSHPPDQVPLQVAVSGEVKAMCGKTWNLAVVSAVAPIASVTRTVNTQSFPAWLAGAGKALVSEKPLSAIPVGRAPDVTLYLNGAIPPL